MAAAEGTSVLSSEHSHAGYHQISSADAQPQWSSPVRLTDVDVANTPPLSLPLAAYAASPFCCSARGVWLWYSVNFDVLYYSFALLVFVLACCIPILRAVAVVVTTDASGSPIKADSTLRLWLFSQCVDEQCGAVELAEVDVWVDSGRFDAARWTLLWSIPVCAVSIGLLLLYRASSRLRGWPLYWLTMSCSLLCCALLVTASLLLLRLPSSMSPQTRSRSFGSLYCFVLGVPFAAIGGAWMQLGLYISWRKQTAAPATHSSEQLSRRSDDM